MQVRLAEAKVSEVDCDALVLPVFEDESPNAGILKEFDERLGGLLTELKERGEWPTTPGTLSILHRPPNLQASRLILTSCGKKAEVDGFTIRLALTKALHKIRGFQIRRVGVYSRSEFDIEAAAQGAVLAAFQVDGYKTRDQSRSFIEQIDLISQQAGDRRQLEYAIEKGRILGEATNLARLLTNEPGNSVNPRELARRAGMVADECGLEIEVLDEKAAEKLQMNAFLAVARGSQEPPQFIVIRHLKDPDRKSPPAVLIGKGVTFDSGGLSLKPPQGMEEMKTDKAGACAVLAAMQAIALLEAPKNVVALLPCVENLPGGRALKPGDIVRAMNGTTVEVLNTDAEGRLILADAIAYARQQLHAAFMIDIATLTGACVVALGHVRAGLFGNSDPLCERVLQASEKAGEKLWRLPLDREYRKEIESDIADIKNVGPRWGGAITAAKFLEEFAGDTPWCHLDIAGVDLFRDNNDLKGPTGFGVRTLVEAILSESPDSL